MHTLLIRRRAAMALGTAALFAGTLAGPAFAADTVTQEITAGGGLSASVADLTLPSVAYENATHDVTGTMVLNMDDSRGTAAGWSVTIMASDFVYSGADVGLDNDIPAADFALTSAEQPTWIAGQAVSLTAANGPQITPTIVYGTLATGIR